MMKQKMSKLEAPFAAALQVLWVSHSHLKRISLSPCSLLQKNSPCGST